MPKYLFTSDQRISVLSDRIGWVARFVQSGNDVSSIKDKSENNNASTLKFYYNLHSGTETCKKAVTDPSFAIRNFVKKFQFPNTRTSESLYDSVNEKTLFAPFRSVVKILHIMASDSRNGIGYISIPETLYFLFCNTDVCQNPNFDCYDIISKILSARENNVDLNSKIEALANQDFFVWKQYTRQARELFKVLPYASNCFKTKDNKISFSINSPAYQNDIIFIKDILNYNLFWYPSNPNNFNLSNLEYISYMDTRETPYTVINFGSHPPKRTTYCNLPLQQIYYGAPGTGKSHTINEITKAQPEDNVVRTTFHPDSDYSTFVGCYKPTKETSNVLSLHKLHELYPEFKKMVDNRPLHRFIAKYYNSFKLLTEKEAESVFDNIETASTVTAEVPKLMAAIEELKSAASISYSFVPQAFTNAYVKAWKSPNEPVFLIIEEINRGNCAQIFGDLFQLLDRNDDGYSCYPIDADTDLCQHLENELGKESEGIKNGKLRLPSNLYIWATMNTSDQSLFPIDSAFKRRWDWVYRPIGYKNSNWTIEIGDKKYNWVDFQKAINQKIYDVDNSEDKQLGDYFVNADRTDFKISADTLLNKILFYIWNDVCKDDPDQIFRCKTDKEEECVKFSDFFDDKIKKLQSFMAFIGVAPYGENKENKQEMPLDTETTETTDTPKE